MAVQQQLGDSGKLARQQSEPGAGSGCCKAAAQGGVYMAAVTAVIFAVLCLARLSDVGSREAAIFRLQMLGDQIRSRAPFALMVGLRQAGIGCSSPSPAGGQLEDSGPLSTCEALARQLSASPPALSEEPKGHWEPLTRTVVAEDGQLTSEPVDPPQYVYVRGSGEQPLRSNQDLARLLAGRRVLMIGDSMSKQISDGFIDALPRAETKDLDSIYQWRGWWDLTMEDTVESIKNKETKDRTLQIDNHRLFQDSYEVTWNLGWPLNIKFGYLRTYKLPAPDGSRIGYANNRTLPGYLFTLYPALLDMAMEEYDVIIVNIGLHYERRITDMYERHVRFLARRLAAFSQSGRGIGIFRETTPQHFLSKDSSGDWEGFLQKGPPDQPMCPPAPNITAQNWRNEIMHQAAREFGVFVAPVFHEMNDHRLHISGSHTFRDNFTCDCSHIKGPAWISFAPVFDSLYRTLEDAIAHKECLKVASQNVTGGR